MRDFTDVEVDVLLRALVSLQITLADPMFNALISVASTVRDEATARKKPKANTDRSSPNGGA